MKKLNGNVGRLTYKKP